MNAVKVKALSEAKRQAQERVRLVLARRHDAHQAAQQADHEYQAALAALEEADAALDAAIDEEEER
jgi:hypothetical protein